MLCKKPFVKGITPYPCGQCTPCRLNRRRLWTHRLLLESQLHEFSSFWTLTYSDEHYPANGSLDPKAVQLWLKRLRALLGPARPIRYYVVGEYGDQTQRAHYHGALFGLAAIEDEIVIRAWGKGFCYSGELNSKTAAYIAGYVTKKMTKPDDPRLNGRHPEFARMSLRPGIGAHAMPVVADALNDKYGARFIAETGDVPLALAHGRSQLPLGRYLRRKLREEMGFTHIGGQAKPEEQRQAEMQALCDAAGGRQAYLLSKPYIEVEKIRQVEGRARIWAKKGTL